MMSDIEVLLKNNEISMDLFYKETYNCFLVSILEVIIAECNDESYKQDLLNRLRNSDNQVLTIKNVVYNRVKCKINDEEAELILTWIKAFYSKKNERKKYDNSVRETIIQKQQHECALCNRRINIGDSELDHIIPFSLVGDELGIDNLQLLCSECNKRKSNSVIYNLKMFLIKNRE